MELVGTSFIVLGLVVLISLIGYLGRQEDIRIRTEAIASFRYSIKAAKNKERKEQEQKATLKAREAFLDANPQWRVTENIVRKWKEVIEKDLGIRRTTVKLHSARTRHACGFADFDRSFTLFPFTMNGMWDNVFTLAHELRHLWQMDDGIFYRLREEDYEADANWYAKDFCKRFYASINGMVAEPLPESAIIDKPKFPSKHSSYPKPTPTVQSKKYQEAYEKELRKHAPDIEYVIIARYFCGKDIDKKEARRIIKNTDRPSSAKVKHALLKKDENKGMYIEIVYWFQFLSVAEAAYFDFFKKNSTWETGIFKHLVKDDSLVPVRPNMRSNMQRKEKV